VVGERKEKGEKTDRSNRLVQKNGSRGRDKDRMGKYGL
jgi:hypothetical protein